MLAILMGGGLILFGVGTGVSGGGLLNAFGGSGGSSQSAQVSSAERQAQKAVNANPSNAPDWAKLLEAQWESATSTGFSSSTGFTTFGKKELRKVTQSWNRYVALAKSPDPGVAVVSGEAYTALNNFSGATNAWETSAIAAPTQRAYECLALSSYAAGDTDKGDLATGKLLSLLPKAQRASQQAQLKLAKTSHTSALQGLAANCEA
jgi:hypothetical protein